MAQNKSTPAAAATRPKVKPELDTTALRAAMARRVARRTTASGRIVLPATPGLIDQHVATIDQIFRAIGRVFSPEELGHARQILQGKMDEAWKISRGCNLVVTYETDPSPAVSLSYKIALTTITREAQYEEWIATREPPLFGTHPDARVMDVARTLGDPAQAPILDVGAGTGRNSLPLARLGHPVDAIEITAGFADELRREASQERVPLRVLQIDATAPDTRLERKYKLVFLSEVVSDMRSPEDLRRTFALASGALVPGGFLLFNAFVAAQGYSFDRAARDFSQTVWSSAFSKNDFEQAAAGLGFSLEADDRVFDYEKEHLPPEAWPPKGWYPEWVNGQDIFDLPAGRCPIDMRWRLYRRALNPGDTSPGRVARGSCTLAGLAALRDQTHEDHRRPLFARSGRL